MKVRCLTIADARGNPATSSPWLTIGKIYHVLAIELDFHNRWLLRLVGDCEPGVGLFPLTQFEVVSARVPDTWVVSWNNAGQFNLSPATWMTPNFWDRYFDHDVDANRAFSFEMSRIIAADP
jgi:hypothetical protein